MKVAVIGSGHAAISATEGLIERGIKPVILDVGETLAPDIQARVNALALSPPENWAKGAALFPTLQSDGKLLQKYVFGSDYLYARGRSYAPMHTMGTAAVPTFAKGGFSVGWGGTVLPAHADDLRAWPFSADRLDAHYVGALKTMPLACETDRLAEAFPLHHDAARAMRPTDQGMRLLQDLEQAQGRLNQSGDRVLFGAARLAVDQESCLKCGMCLTGCPYGLIYTLDRALQRLIDARSVHYQPGAYVVSVEESAGVATVNWIDIATNNRHADTFDRVFVGAGALSSARIVLNSLKAYDRPVAVKDSAKFAIPMLRLTGADFEWPATNTLADLFIEAVLPSISARWLHIQTSPLNDLMLRALHMCNEGETRWLNGLGRIAKPLASRLMVAWCGLHSDLSSRCELTVTLGSDGLPVLNVSADPARNPGSARYVRAYGRKLARMGLKFGTLFLTPATMLTQTCATGHCGGSFPMREKPDAPFETDTLGRLKSWERIHLVDPSVFPTIPGTTIALLIRANARRIVAETRLDSPS
jgi:ferredoxin